MRLLRDYLIVQPGVALGMQGGACSEPRKQFWEVSKMDKRIMEEHGRSTAAISAMAASDV